jgi:hypothetical protein
MPWRRIVFGAPRFRENDARVSAAVERPASAVGKMICQFRNPIRETRVIRFGLALQAQNHRQDFPRDFSRIRRTRRQRLKYRATMKQTAD